VYVCVCVCIHTLKEKWLELLTPNLVHICSVTGPRQALTMRSKGQGHRVMKCAAGMGLYVVRLLRFLVLLLMCCSAGVMMTVYSHLKPVTMTRRAQSP